MPDPTAIGFVPSSEPPGVAESGSTHLRISVHTSGSVRIDESLSPADDDPIYLGLLDDRHCWAVDVPGEADSTGFSDLHSLWASMDEVRWTLAGRAVQLVEWRRTHRHCGRCGTLTEPVAGERAMRCPDCGLLAFPRLAPAVIVLIEREDRVLLARNVNFPIPMYSLLAGFVEPGETMEQAVARETVEEVGITVDDIRYWGSQPWPFPHSLMIGFRARYISGDLVLQESEIADAGWFAPDDLPIVPPPMSIARSMIDAWLAEGRSRS